MALDELSFSKKVAILVIFILGITSFITYFSISTGAFNQIGQINIYKQQLNNSMGNITKAITFQKFNTTASNASNSTSIWKPFNAVSNAFLGFINILVDFIWLLVSLIITMVIAFEFMAYVMLALIPMILTNPQLGAFSLVLTPILAGVLIVVAFFMYKWIKELVLAIVHGGGNA